MADPGFTNGGQGRVFFDMGVVFRSGSHIMATLGAFGALFFTVQLFGLNSKTVLLGSCILFPR